MKATVASLVAAMVVNSVVKSAAWMVVAVAADWDYDSVVRRDTELAASMADDWAAPKVESKDNQTVDRSVAIPVSR